MRIDILESVKHCTCMSKSAQLQIRVTPAEKARLRRAARAAGQDVSTYVLERVLPAERERFQAVIRALARESDDRYALAELHDLLAGWTRREFEDAVEQPPREILAPVPSNYVAAMVEHAARRHGIRPPPWVDAVAPLEAPVFGSSLPGLRPYLLRAAPLAFKRRNIFVDATVGARV